MGRYFYDIYSPVHRVFLSHGVCVIVPNTNACSVLVRCLVEDCIWLRLRSHERFVGIVTTCGLERCPFY